MKKIITLKLFKENRLEQEYKDISAIVKEDSIIFKLEDVKTIINNNTFTRETNEYKFELNIKEKKSTYLLKQNNILFDIDVKKISYKKEDNYIILEYKLSTDEEQFKIEINIKGEINE